MRRSVVMVSTFLITGDDRIAAEWAGLMGESEIRQQLDRLIES